MKIWFQALEFSVSRSVAKYFVSAVERKGETQKPYRLRSSFSSYSGKKHLATVQETENSSAWNHIFDLHRQGPPRRTVKVMSLFDTLTGVHQGAHIRSASFRPDGNVRSWSIKTKCPQEKKGGRRTSSIFVVGTVGNVSFCFVGSATQVTLPWLLRCTTYHVVKREKTRSSNRIGVFFVG